jgi:hypothetical protein
MSLLANSQGAIYFGRCNILKSSTLEVSQKTTSNVFGLRTISLYVGELMSLPSGIACAKPDEHTLFALRILICSKRH